MCEYCDNEYWYSKHHGSKNFDVPSNVHIMNKDESKLLRRLMSDNNMSENEVRDIKKYRIMLSNAQKVGQKRKTSRGDKLRKSIMKSITRELKLAKEHPLVVEAYNKKINDIKSGKDWWRSHDRFLLTLGY